MNNDLSMNYINLYVSPELEYKKGGLEAKFNMPVSLAPYRYHDKIQELKDSDTRISSIPEPLHTLSFYLPPICFGVGQVGTKSCGRTAILQWTIIAKLPELFPWTYRL